MARADLIIKAKDLEDIERDLTQVSQSFEAYAKTTDSLEDAVGEPKLGGKLAWFAERWRIKRGKMSEQFEALRKEVQTQREAWDDTDAALAGEDGPHDNDDYRPDDRPDDDKPTGDKRRDDDKLSDDTPLDDNQFPQPRGPGSGGQLNSTSGDRSKTASSTDDLGSATAVEGPGDGPTDQITGGLPKGGGDGAGATGGDGSTDQITGGDVTAEDLVQGAAVGGVVGSIYTLWQSARERAAGGGSTEAGGSESGQSVEQMLRQDLDSAGLGDKVELSTDPGDPDDIIALLRQDDGSSLRLEFEDGDGDPALGEAAGGASALSGEAAGDDWRSLLREPAAGGALDAAETPLDTSAGGGAGGGGGGSLGGGDSLLSGDDLSAGGGSAAAVDLGGGTAAARPADWSETPAATASPSNVSSDSAADSGGIASLGGMAAMRMGGMGGRSGGGSYEERRRKRHSLVETERLETPEGQEKK
ncbi:MAG: hypothetical protein LBL55_06130 [Propionibacteriaceae bacterium]|jgi:hypothetical protein|nr:hypothetical protein [Propionibacteriaceae bacterium]